jgi:hypothetical protein
MAYFIVVLVSGLCVHSFGRKQWRHWHENKNTFIIFLVSGFGMALIGPLSLGALSMRFIFLPLLLLNKNRSNMEAVSLQWDLSSVRVFLNILSTFALTCLAWIFFRAKSIEMLLITLNEF